MSNPLHYHFTAHKPTVELAYTETIKALTTVMENGGSEWDLEAYLIQTLTFDRSDAVLAGVIDYMIDLHKEMGEDGLGLTGHPPAEKHPLVGTSLRSKKQWRMAARRGQKKPTVKSRESIAAAFRSRGFKATVED